MSDAISKALQEVVDRVLVPARDQHPRNLCKRTSHRWLEDLLGMLFPPVALTTVESDRDPLDRLTDLNDRLGALLACVVPGNERGEPSPTQTLVAFWEALPNIAQNLFEDLEFFKRQDPAATSIEEIMVCYPGFFAISTHRIGHFFQRRGYGLLARVWSEFAHTRTGIDIHPGATLGVPCFIDHGTGVVIGETAEVGKRVKIYQGVTLGAKSVHKNLRGKKRHPTVEDDVVIYANATVLGGETVIGAESVIGGNVWLTRSVPQRTHVLLNEKDAPQVHKPWTKASQ